MVLSQMTNMKSLVTHIFADLDVYKRRDYK